MKTLAELKSEKIIGNAYHDMRLMMNINDFICDETQSMAERKEAYRYLSEDVMGCPIDGEVTDAQIAEVMEYN